MEKTLIKTLLDTAVGGEIFLTNEKVDRITGNHEIARGAVVTIMDGGYNWKNCGDFRVDKPAAACGKKGFIIRRIK